MKADANPLKIGSTSIRGNGRATIKAHSATPHHTRPYGSRISPARMESPLSSILTEALQRSIFLSSRKARGHLDVLLPFQVMNCLRPSQRGLYYDKQQ